MNKMNNIIIGNSAYWEKACQFFSNSNYDKTTGSYFYHNKNRHVVRIGLVSQNTVSYQDGMYTLTRSSKKQRIDLADKDSKFKEVKCHLIEGVPRFFLVSPDINRDFKDGSLPEILFVQPTFEFIFSTNHPNGIVAYAKDDAAKKKAKVILRTGLEKKTPALTELIEPSTSFSVMSAHWSPAEQDEQFVGRLRKAIALLQNYPDGKMTITRAYERPIGNRNHPFSLYERHARMNGEYSCSHFFCIDDGVFSIGCSPENVFEIYGDQLHVDVVAATCKSSERDDFVAEQLSNNPKQLKEHTSSLHNRRNRFVPFCENDSIKVIRELQIKRLRNVYHLHSVFQGTLLPRVNVFDILQKIFPLLGARPQELLPFADTEESPHRYYGGIVGHADAQAVGCFLNLRNALIVNDLIHAKVGVGIIKESRAADELLETRDKISGLMEAIRLWEASSR